MRDRTDSSEHTHLHAWCLLFAFAQEQDHSHQLGVPGVSKCTKEKQVCRARCANPSFVLSGSGRIACAALIEAKYSTVLCCTSGTRPIRRSLVSCRSRHATAALPCPALPDSDSEKPGSQDASREHVRPFRKLLCHAFLWSGWEGLEVARRDYWVGGRAGSRHVYCIT